MTYRNILHSTTADSSDINDDFYHIGQGTRYPLYGYSLGYTNGACDIGSSTKKWNDVYSNSIKLSNSIGTFACISNIVLSTTSERIEITGLNSDNDVFYIANMQATFAEPTATGYFSLFINGDSTSSYNTFDLNSINNTITCYPTWIAGAAVKDSATSARIGHYYNGVTTGTQFCSSSFQINTQRQVISRWSTGFGIHVYEAVSSISKYSNTSATITSIVIEGRWGIGSNIQLYGVR